MPPAEELYVENRSLKEENAQLRAQLEWFKRKVFGGGQSEKLPPLPEPAQAPLALEGLAERAALPPLQTVTYERRKPSGEKRPLAAETFAKLPVHETVVVEPPEVQAAPECFEKIGEERTFEVDIIPPKLFKREIVRPKYRRKAERMEAPVIAPAPPRPVPGGYASAGLVAFVVISKYQDHLPLYRLEQMSRRWGATLSRQTMVEWVRIAADWAEPIYKCMVADLLAGGYVQCDETPVKYIDPDEKRGGTFQGYLWVMSRPGGDVVFDWRVSRRHAELTTLLTGKYKGVLQSDGYEAYAAYARNHPGVDWVGCWAHARRAFFEAQNENRRVATAVLRLIARLYRRERAWDEANLPAELRASERAKPEGLARTMKSLHRLALWARQRVLPKSLLGKACDYLLHQWEPLSAHLRHGCTRLDNNLVENAIRPSCIGKKNWLFIGHPAAGQRSAILYSLIVSCQRHGKDPLVYLRDVLTRLPAMTTRHDLAPLLPRNWTPASDVTAGA
jgi:transposase